MYLVFNKFVLNSLIDIFIKIFTKKKLTKPIKYLEKLNWFLERFCE